MRNRVICVGCAIAGLCYLGGVAAEAPKRPADFRPYRNELTSEQLSEKYSVDQMRRAEKELQEMAEVNRKGPWRPTWESIDQHQAPEWFLDAKLGIMINWGLYSVPAWDQKREGAMYPDAYASSMYSDPTLMAHHAQYWGKDFQYDDFFALFSAKNYDPEAWMRLLEEVGVRYVVPFCKHHDGVAWWDSAWSKRSFVQMGPKRDLFTPLQTAAKRHGLKVIMYFCYEEYATAVLGPDNRPNCRTWNGAYARLNAMTDENRRRVQGHIPVTNYYDHYMTPLVKEMIDRFEPDGLWMDGEWATSTETLRSRELAAYFYNKVGSSKAVYVNDRYGKGTRNHHGDVFGSEFHSTSSLIHAWEECRGISHSFAYNYEDDDSSLMSAEDLVHMFIDVISHNGNLDLIIGPDSTGRIPELQADRLKLLGRWIKTNTDAVYGTRILPPYAQKETGICYTRSQDARYAYVFCRRWPGVRLRLDELGAQPNSEIHMLGVSTPLAWKQDASSLVIDVPEALQDPDNRPCKYAWVFKIPMQPKVCLEPDPFRYQVTFKTIGEIDQIRYTLDGTEPTAQSALVNGPVALPASSTLAVKARAFRGGNAVGRVASTAVTTPPPVPPKPGIWLDELDPARFITGWQATGVKTWRNVNCHGNPLKVQGQEFRRGIGLHANAEVVFPLTVEWARFVCRVGIDDRAEGQGTIRVKLFLDNSLRAETPMLTGKDGLWNIDLKLRESGEQPPARALRIVVDDNGDGIMGDNADFVDAGFLVENDRR